MSTTPPTPRRKLRLMRWFVLLSVAIFAWGGWREIAFRAALKEAVALGWLPLYTDPVEEIRADWKSAFKKKTWTDGVIGLQIPSDADIAQHLQILRRLNPRQLDILDASRLRDLSPFISLTRLDALWLNGCTNLINVNAIESLSGLKMLWLIDCPHLADAEALRSLTALEDVSLRGCAGLTNVDALKHLLALREVDLRGCTGLTNESVAALKAALPKAEITGP